MRKVIVFNMITVDGYFCGPNGEIEINKDSILKLKQSSAKDIAIYGSGQIVQEFSKLGLIDEYRLMVNPVILGKGKPLFKHDQKLKLLRSREFQNGNVLLCYQPDK